MQCKETPFISILSNDNGQYRCWQTKSKKRTFTTLNSQRSSSWRVNHRWHSRWWGSRFSSTIVPYWWTRRTCTFNARRECIETRVSGIKTMVASVTGCQWSHVSMSVTLICDFPQWLPSTSTIIMVASSSTALEGRLLDISDALEDHGKVISDAFTTDNPSLFDVHPGGVCMFLLMTNFADKM